MSVDKEIQFHPRQNASKMIRYLNYSAIWGDIMKDQRNKRKRVDDEANFIGDVLRLLFALSIAVVTIVAGFILFKNIYGFTLPNLKQTEASVEQTKEAVVITEEVKETKNKKTESLEVSQTESTVESADTPKESTTEVAKEKEETKESSTTKEDKSEKESKKEKESIGESPTLESKKSKTQESSQGTKNSDNAVIGEGPEIADRDEEVGPGVVSP